MIKQVINIRHYWKVIVYYNVDYNFFDIIYDELKNIEVSDRGIEKVYRTMVTGKAKAVTISNKDLQTSIVLFNTHRNKYDYISSIVHEAEHIKQHVLDYYNIIDYGEPPAYTIGFIVMNMYKIFNKII